MVDHFYWITNILRVRTGILFIAILLHHLSQSGWYDWTLLLAHDVWFQLSMDEASLIRFWDGRESAGDGGDGFLYLRGDGINLWIIGLTITATRRLLHLTQCHTFLSKRLRVEISYRVSVRFIGAFLFILLFFRRRWLLSDNLRFGCFLFLGIDALNVR